MSFDTIWSLALADGESGKIVFVGRDSGVLQKFDGKFLDTPLLTLSPHTGPITSIFASSGDEVYTASIDQTVKQLSTAAEVEGKRELKNFEIGAAVRCMIQVGENYYCGAHDNNIHILGGEKIQQLRGHSDWVVALVMSETNLLSASYDHTVRGWDIGAGRCTFVLRGHTNQVKALQVVGTTVFTASRDETLRVWTIPSDQGEGGTAPPATTEEGEKGEEGNPATSTAEGESASGPAPMEVKCIGVVEIPAAPHCSVMSGSQMCLGFTDQRIRSIATKELATIVTDFDVNIKASYRKCKSNLDKNTNLAIKKVKTQTKRAIKQKKKELKEEVTRKAKEAERIAREAKTAERQAQEGDEEEGQQEPEAVQDEEAEGEGAEVQLGEEEEKELAAFTDDIQQKSAASIKEIQGQQAEKIATLKPITQQEFFCEKSKFDAVNFTRTFAQQKDAVVALQFDGITAYSAVGNDVTVTSCRPGISVL